MSSTKPNVCFKNKPINLSKLSFDTTDKKTFELSLSSLMKSLYNVTPNKTNAVVQDDPGVREAFNKTFSDFLTQQIQDNGSEYIMLYILINVLNSLLDAYKVHKNVTSYLLYRGGNVLKMYKDKFINTLSDSESKLLSEYFDKFFEASDIDFMIFFDEAKIDPLKQKEMRKEIQALCHYGLSVARDLLLYSGNIYPFCNYDDDKLHETFMDLLDKVNIDKETNQNEFVKECEFVGLGFNDFWIYDDDVNIPDYLKFHESTTTFNLDEINNKNTATVYRTNMIRSSSHSGNFDFISIDKKAFRTIILVNYLSNLNFFKDTIFNKIKDEILNELNQLHYMYITDNTKIHNIINMAYFKLSRLLMCFTLIYYKDDKYGLFNAFGEIYDLSIINKGDVMYHIYRLDNTYERKIKFKYNNSNMTVNVRIPKMKLAIEDLARILFLKRFPWSDNKYEKRVYRLYLLLFIYSLKKTDRKHVSKDMKDLDRFKDYDGKDTKFDVKLLRRNYNYMKTFKLRKDNEEKLNEFYKIIVGIEEKLIDVLR
jgi:hypothetical protein